MTNGEFPPSDKNNWSSDQEKIKERAERAEKALVTGLIDITIRALKDKADLNNPLRVKGLVSEIEPITFKLRGEGFDWPTVRNRIKEAVYRGIESQCESAVQYEVAHRIYERLADELLGRTARASQEGGERSPK